MKPTKQLLESLARAGIKLPVPSKPKAGKSLVGCRFAPGILVVAFHVPHRPCPWKAPTTTRTGVAFKDKRLVAWQKAVATRCAMAMAGMAPYAHPVRLEMDFELTRRPGSIPDLSNLTKSTEDALQRLAIVNDKAVREIKATRTIGDADGVMIRVYSTGDI